MTSAKEMPSSSGNIIVKNTLFLYFRMFITMLVSLFTVRVVLKTLGVVDYGVYNVIGGVVTTMAFITDVLANASQRFFAVELGRKDTNKLQQTFGLIMVAYLLVAVVILVIGETLGVWFVNSQMDIPIERKDAAMVVYQFSLASFLVSMVISPFNALIIAHERMNVYAYVSILLVFLKLGIVYLLVIIHYDKLKVYALLMFLVSVLISSIYVIICRRSFPESKFMFRWDKKIFSSIFSYSSWTLLGTLAFVFNTQGLNILFNLFFGPVANAAYAIGNQVKTTINSFASNFFVATRPAMIKSYSEGNYQYTNKLFYFSSKIIFSLLFIMIAPLFVEIDYILRLWLGEVELYMPGFVRLMLIYAIVLSVSEPITAIAQAAGKVKIYHGLVDSFTLLTLPLTYIGFKIGLEPQWGFIISIVVFIIAHILRLIVLRSFYVLSLREYTVNFILPCIITLIVTVCSIIVLKQLSASSLLTIFVTIIIAGVSIWLFEFNRDEKKYVLSIVRKKIFKKND